PPRTGDESFEQAQGTGFYSLLLLVQALGNRDGAEPIRIEVISNDIHDVTGQEPLRPEKVTILGICAVIPQEYLNIACRSIDVTVPAAGSWQAARLIDNLVADIGSEPSDPVVRYR